jgi:hypothetical protein
MHRVMVFAAGLIGTCTVRPFMDTKGLTPVANLSSTVAENLRAFGPTDQSPPVSHGYAYPHHGTSPVRGSPLEVARLLWLRNYYHCQLSPDSIGRHGTGTTMEVATMVQLKVNHQDYAVEVSPEMPLLWVLRETLQLTGAKYGCGMALCGACTIHLDGEAVRSCVTPVSHAMDKVEHRSGKLSSRAWLHHSHPLTSSAILRRTGGARFAPDAAAGCPAQRA